MALVPADPGEGPVPAAEPANRPVTGALKLGPAIDLGAGSADATGGAITVNVAGDPLNGLTIDVPAGTYSSTVSFTLSERPITGSPFAAAGLTPVSPLLTVMNGGVVAAGDPVTVHFPATIPAGASAAAFYYDAKTGGISPLTVVDQSATGVTVATAHFTDLFLALLD